MFVYYVNQTWIIPHKEKFVKAWTNKVMPLGNTTTNSHEPHDQLQHNEIKASFETTTHVVGHVFKVTLYKRLLGMVSRYTLNQIAAQFELVHYAGKNPSRCGCVMRTTHGLPCACELSKYVVGTIPLETIHMLSFSDEGLSEPQMTIIEEMETIFSKLRKISYPDLNFICPPPENVNTKSAKKKPMTKHQRSTKRDPSYWEYVDTLHSMQNSNSSVKCSASSSDQTIPRRTMLMVDQFHSFIHDSIENIVDVKVDGNCGYRAIATLLGIGENSWSLVRNHLLKELAKWSDEYIKLLDDIDIFEELKRSLLVDGLSMVFTLDKWMDITDMGYVFASRSQPPTDSSVHRVICIGHVYDNHFVQIYLRDYCPLPPLALLWSRNCHPQAKQ
ncbi:hypothetical protein GmHk_16G046843 [Glycine max]|nr:hypothetical protein GmHk_16G046843 [Glycine max]